MSDRLVNELLSDAVREFIERLRPVVLSWPEAQGANADGVTNGLRFECRRLAAAFLCADGRLGDRQLLALRRTFGPGRARARERPTRRSCAPPTS